MSSGGGLGYGLNQRNNKKRKKRGGLTGFADSDDSSSDDNNSNTAGRQLSGRSAINREIAAEQAALRKRAEAAMASSNMDSAMYDYDGEYDSFALAGKKESSSTKTQQKEAAAEKGQSRYISNLLKSSQRRAQEQEIIYERKVAKEQAGLNMEYEGKEQFITSAYKKKLAEREAWAKEEEVRAKREAEDDVTQKKGGNFLFAGFGRNVIMGVNNNKQSSTENTDEVQPKNDDDIPPTNDSRKEKEASPQSHQRRDYSRQSEAVARDRKPQPTGRIQESTKTSESEAKEKPMTRSQILAERAVKIRDARERYFQRLTQTMT
ncbi:hypothetical protein ACHAWC_009776 [Mediolabrus comicus]